MAKRFGRNQKRKIAEAIKAANRARDALYTTHAIESEREIVRLKGLLAKAVIMDVEILINRADMTAMIRAKFESQAFAVNPHYYTHRIDPRDLKMQRNKDARHEFLNEVGRHIAAAAWDHFSEQKRRY